MFDCSPCSRSNRFLLACLSNFLAYSNPFCNLPGPRECAWTGYGTMRVVEKALKVGKFQIIFSMNREVLNTTTSCVGMCVNPWTSMSGDTSFGYSSSSSSVSYSSNGPLHHRNNTQSGNASWTANKSDTVLVGMEVDLKKSRKNSILIYFMQGKRQPAYHRNIPSNVLFGVCSNHYFTFLILLPSFFFFLISSFCCIYR